MNVYVKILTVAGSLVATAAVIFLNSASTTADKQTVNVSQGMVAVIDKESGELRAPTADEARQFQSKAQASEAPLTVVRRADGSESMKLDDRYTTYSMVERNSDGSWARRCSLDHDHALHTQKAVQ